MAISTNRSLSPISRRTNSSNRSVSPILRRQSSSSRNPESSSNTRKSFSGGNPLTRPSIVPNARSFNPITPANSPADSSQRNWVCKEGIASLLSSYDHKENEKDQNLKPMRVRSPAVSMGSKNFMAPTISAASKIAPSPRKKVLAERNEAAKTTSVSMFEEKSPFASMNEKEFVEEIGSKLKVIFDSQILSETQNTLESSSMEAPSIPVSGGGKPTMNPLNSLVVDETGSKPDEGLHSQKLSFTHTLSESLSEPRFVDSKTKPPSSSSPVLAPLDVDPSVPYDPKTNYLSPRPQFLHYKPNPRIEVYLNKEKGFDPGEGGRRLEDSFTSESCSDAENTEEIQFSDSQIEDDSSELISEEEKETEVSGPKHDYTHEKKVKTISNSHSFVRSKSLSLLWILVVACLSFSVIDCPLITPSVSKVQTFSKFDSTSKMAELAKANLHELAYDFRLWSVKSFLYLSKMISIPRATEELGSSHFMNLTALDEELLVDFGGYEVEEKQGKNSLEPEKEKKTEEEPKGEQHGIEIETEGPETGEEPNGEQNFVGIKTEEPKMEEQTEEKPKEDQTQALEFEEQSLISQGLEIEPQLSEAVEFHDEDTFDSMIKSEPLDVEVTPQSSEFNTSPQSSDINNQSSVSSIQFVNSHSTEQPPEFSVHGSEDNSHAINVLGIASVLLTLVASTVLLYLKRRNTSTKEAAVLVKQLPPKKLVFGSLSASGDGQNLYQERPTSQHWSTEVVEMNGQSGPLEMSSSLSCSRRGSERANEARSHERILKRNPNRESLASSSGFSAETTTPSYGSFTTYERINGKNRCGEEEVVTPVRRSRRISNQVITSPS